MTAMEGLGQVVARNVEEAWEVIRALAQECRDGRSDRVEEAVELGVQFGIVPSEIFRIFREARVGRSAAQVKLRRPGPEPGTKILKELGLLQEEPKAKSVPVRTWDEVVVPEGASELEGLTYVPGLVGDIV